MKKLLIICCFIAECLALTEQEEQMQLLEQLELLERMETQERLEFKQAINMANRCTRSRSFECTEQNFAKARKNIQSSNDRNVLAQAERNLENEIATIKREIKEAEEERRRQEKAIKEAREREERERREAEERRRRAEEDRKTHENIMAGINAFRYGVDSYVAQRQGRAAPRMSDYYTPTSSADRSMMNFYEESQQKLTRAAQDVNRLNQQIASYNRAQAAKAEANRRRQREADAARREANLQKQRERQRQANAAYYAKTKAQAQENYKKQQERIKKASRTVNIKGPDYSQNFGGYDGRMYDGNGNQYGGSKSYAQNNSNGNQYGGTQSYTQNNLNDKQRSNGNNKADREYTTWVSIDVVQSGTVRDQSAADHDSLKKAKKNTRDSIKTKLHLKCHNLGFTGVITDSIHFSHGECIEHGLAYGDTLWKCSASGQGHCYRKGWNNENPTNAKDISHTDYKMIDKFRFGDMYPVFVIKNQKK